MCIECKKLDKINRRLWIWQICGLVLIIAPVPLYEPLLHHVSTSTALIIGMAHIMVVWFLENSILGLIISRSFDLYRKYGDIPCIETSDVFLDKENKKVIKFPK